MVIISYDIKNDKLRTKFSKYLSRFGYRLQYSVWRINNSERMLNNIALEIKGNFMKKFGEEDSVYIFQMSTSCRIECYGYAKHGDEELIVVNRGKDQT